MTDPGGAIFSPMYVTPLGLPAPVSAIVALTPAMLAELGLTGFGNFWVMPGFTLSAVYPLGQSPAWAVAAAAAAPAYSNPRALYWVNPAQIVDVIGGPGDLNAAG